MYQISKTKLKAFTIMEVMIVMVITSIVVFLAYSSSSLFYKEYLLFKSRFDRTSEISLLDRLLYSDFSDSNILIKKEDGIECIYKNKTVRYSWTYDYVLRNQEEVSDTFHFKISNLHMNFLTEEAKENEILDEITFELLNNEEKASFHYHKKYAADVLINYSEKK